MNLRILVVSALCAQIAVCRAVADDTSSVAVQTAKARQGSVPDMLTVYGVAGPAVDGGMTLSFQQDGRVTAIAVTPGETVRKGTRLLDFSASASAISAYQQAATGLTAAEQQRTHTAQLLAQQLATRDQLAQAEKAVTDARSALDALRREGGDETHRSLTAPFDGIIASIPVAQGDRVQAGATLMTITRLDGLVVTVGVEPSDRARVHFDDSVKLTPLAGGAALEGRVLRVDGVLNPKTRLLDADISAPVGAIVSGTAFKAEIRIGDFRGWIVPHDALLHDDKGAYLFQVAGAEATRVNVELLGAAETEDVVTGPLDPKMPIVVQGNYQLSDKTRVRQDGAL
jgi:RND family efflux transporter MFP subunit